jgi:hypothetical protein
LLRELLVLALEREALDKHVFCGVCGVALLLPPRCEELGVHAGKEQRCGGGGGGGSSIISIIGCDTGCLRPDCAEVG